MVSLSSLVLAGLAVAAEPVLEGRLVEIENPIAYDIVNGDYYDSTEFQDEISQDILICSDRRLFGVVTYHVAMEKGSLRRKGKLRESEFTEEKKYCSSLPEPATWISPLMQGKDPIEITLKQEGSLSTTLYCSVDYGGLDCQEREQSTPQVVRLDIDDRGMYLVVQSDDQHEKMNLYRMKNKGERRERLQKIYPLATSSHSGIAQRFYSGVSAKDDLLLCDDRKHFCREVDSVMEQLVHRPMKKQILASKQNLLDGYVMLER